MDPKRIGWWAGLVAAVLLTWLLNRTASPNSSDGNSQLKPLLVEETVLEVPPSLESSKNSIPQFRPPVNPVAAKLNDPTLTAQDDVANVHQLLEQMFGVWKTTRRPMSLNAEFTTALTGDNPVRLPFLPSEHPAIINGELTDRWGTPYQFHLLAMDRIEVRSAGPDGRLYTEDDALYSPWTKKPPGG